MRVVLCAARAIGAEIARAFNDAACTPCCLVLDIRDTAENRRAILGAFTERPRLVLLNTDLENEQTERDIAGLQLDLGFLAWWPDIVRQPLLGATRLGTLNCHPSLLPFNRGKHYNFWAIVEQAPFGVTLHWIDEGIDTGDIAFRDHIAFDWTDTGETLYHRAQSAMVEIVRRSLPRIMAGDIPRIPQDLSIGSFHRAAEIDEGSHILLDQEYTGRQLLNILRARTFPPHPGAWFEDGGETFEIRVSVTKRNSGP